MVSLRRLDFSSDVSFLVERFMLLMEAPWCILHCSLIEDSVMAACG